MSVYINLYHGRKHVAEQMHDWGCAGPSFEVKAVIFTYGTLRVILDDDGTDWSIGGQDLIYYDGMYYGDAEISATPISNPVDFDRDKAFPDISGEPLSIIPVDITNTY